MIDINTDGLKDGIDKFRKHKTIQTISDLPRIRIEMAELSPQAT